MAKQKPQVRMKATGTALSASCITSHLAYGVDPNELYPPHSGKMKFLCMRADAAAKAAAAAAGADEGNERFLKRFLQYARSHCFPRLTPEAAQQLQAEYVSIRQQVCAMLVCAACVCAC